MLLNQEQQSTILRHHLPQLSPSQTFNCSRINLTHAKKLKNVHVADAWMPKDDSFAKTIDPLCFKFSPQFGPKKSMPGRKSIWIEHVPLSRTQAVKGKSEH